MSLLLTTPSSGLNEVLCALYAARGHNGNHVDASRLLRHLPTRTSLADVDTVLDGADVSLINTDGSDNVALTAAGVAYYRAHKPRHSRIVCG